MIATYVMTIAFLNKKHLPMVTAIIPAYNEGSTIRRVIQIVKKCAAVSEVILIDDKSTDNTVAEARKENIKIYTSKVKGKGSSMREGIQLASHDIIAFIDADITTYPDDVIDRLTRPVILQQADFVKSYFERQAGRVTELVAKPLLSFLFPHISHFKQPLSGMIAGKKEWFEKLVIEDDYGVDIGILIDMYKNGASITEVSLGYIENRMQNIAQLAKMSKEVTKAILKRSGQFLGDTLGTIAGIHLRNENREQLTSANSKNKYHRMAIFDMDKTILKESFIYTMADKFSFRGELGSIVKSSPNSFVRIKKIALLLKGISISDIIKTADEIPMVEDTAGVIKQLQSKGYVCGIISESYDVVTNYIAQKLGMNFSLGNELEINKGIATGEVKIPSLFLHNRKSLCNHDYCKSNAVLEISRSFGIPINNVLATGNGKNDICMIKNAGIGVAFCTENKMLEKTSDYTILNPEFSSLLHFA
jgi:glucosyl-3-phosphoglycerate synthase